MAELVILDGKYTGQRFPLAVGATTHIGRVPGNEIVLDQPSVSSAHCQIVNDASGWHIRDTNSTNGLRVNGARVTQLPLYRNDAILFGDLAAKIEGDDVPVRPPTVGMRPVAPEAAAEEAAAEEEVAALPTRQPVTVATATAVFPAVVPPDFAKRHDTRPIWIGAIIVLLIAIVLAAVRFYKSLS